MKLRKLFITAFTIATFATIGTSLDAQDYRTAFGVRLGYDSGLTHKRFFAPSNAMEFIFSASPRWVQLTGLYEYQQPIADTPGLEWYIGLGPHLGFVHHKDHPDKRILLGADIIGGIEYIFPRAPFTVSLDWKPSFNFINNYNEFWYSAFALSLRYTLR